LLADEGKGWTALPLVAYPGAVAGRKRLQEEKAYQEEKGYNDRDANGFGRPLEPGGVLAPEEASAPWERRMP
jgi:hypothetical protein